VRPFTGIHNRDDIEERGMKKEYAKPVLAKRETLAAVAAITAIPSGKIPDA